MFEHNPLQNRASNKWQTERSNAQAEGKSHRYPNMNSIKPVNVIGEYQ